MDVREIRASSQDDAKEGYNFNGRELLNLGKNLHELSFLCAKTSLVGVQLTL